MRTTNRSSSTAEDMNGKMSPALIELHVYTMPSDLWREHLHSAISKIVDDTVSAGFIRVPPDLPLSKVRREIAQQIGTSNVVPQSYVFIKSVGRCFTRLTHRQERELLAKHFAPPIADVPEIFLLDSAAPGPNEQQSSDYDEQPSGRNRLMEMLRNRKKRTASSGSPTTKSSTPQSAARIPRAPSTSSSDHSTATPVPPPSSLPLPRRRLPAEFDVGQPRHSSTEKLAHSQPPLAPTPVVAPAGHEPHVSRHPATPQSVKWSPPLDEPVEDRSVASAHNRSRQDWHEPQHNEELHPAQSGNLLNELENEKKRLRKELKHLRTRRNEMERLRQELTKRVKQLNASNALSRKQAREDWKKRYYDEKKKSTPKEEQCTKLRHELEQWHRRISSQLEMARETGRRVGGQQVTDQAELKIKSTKCEQDIEELHTRLQNVKLRLTTEIKLRNQAEMEMQALKFDLAEKKSTAHRSRSQAYYAAAHNNAQDVQLSARIQANMGASGSAPMHPSATVGTANHPASGIPVSQARNSQPSATFARTSHSRW